MKTDYIAEYEHTLRRRRTSERTIYTRIPFLRRADRELPCGLMTACAEEIEMWLFKPQYADWTLATYFYHLDGFYGWAADPRTDLLDFNPMSVLDKPTAEQGLPRPITTPQLHRLMAELSGGMLIAAKLAAYAGLRCIEVSRADREHFDVENIRIPVGKGKRPGIVPIHPLIWDAVRDLPPGPVLRRKDGKRWGSNHLSEVASEHFTAVLGEPVGLHRLRHWFGTEVYRQTRDLRRTQELMRHKSPNSTIIYTLIADEERAGAIASLPALPS